MKTEAEIKERYLKISLDLAKSPVKPSYSRNMLIKEYKVLRWVLS